MYTGPLKDVKVRQALQWAFDKSTDNKVAWGGRAQPTWNPFEKSPYSIGKRWPGGGPTPSFDPEQGQEHARRRGGVEPQAEHDDPQGARPVEARGRGTPAGLQEGRHRGRHPGAAGDAVVRPALHEAEPRRDRRQRRLAAVPVGADRELHDEGVAAQEPAEVPEAGDPGAGGCVQHRVLTEERGAVRGRAQGRAEAHAHRRRRSSTR